MPSGPRSRSTPGKKTKAAGPASSVDDFIRELEHPMKADVESLRQVILNASLEIGEEIKWNAPSFKTTEHFATMNLRGKDGVRVILHTGAKVKASAPAGLAVSDPEGLLQWLAKDRACVTFSDADDIKAKQKAFQALIREWIRLV